MRQTGTADCERRNRRVLPKEAAGLREGRVVQPVKQDRLGMFSKDGAQFIIRIPVEKRADIEELDAAIGLQRKMTAQVRLMHGSNRMAAHGGVSIDPVDRAACRCE